MAENTKEERKGIPWGFALLAMLIFYPLSLGPIWGLSQNGYITSSKAGEVFRIFYFPLKWLYENSEIVEKVLDWYIAFWGG